MIHGIHLEVVIVDAYALFLVGVAAILEFVARHSHERSEHFRNSGFVYKRGLDVWECPTGHHLERERTDFERKIAHYRAPAHKCNNCRCKQDCTDSDRGRLLESRVDSWLQSEMSRFHRGISLALFLLATIILVGEMFRDPDRSDWLAIAVLLLPIGFCGSRHLAAFFERPAGQRSSSRATLTERQRTLPR
ncbi:MAG: hypothetical protein JO069_10985 [Verrucomicrobia bacterium]|nr:hypothetical protein [Verrucomicrobiota bacterium]